MGQTLTHWGVERRGHQARGSVQGGGDAAGCHVTFIEARETGKTATKILGGKMTSTLVNQVNEKVDTIIKI